MKQWPGIVILMLALSACTAPHAIVEKAPVPVGESVVRDDTTALRIALDFIRASGEARELRLETASAGEVPDAWHVVIQKREDVRPPIALIRVDKRTGEAERIPLR
jgi:hypothetical protein